MMRTRRANYQEGGTPTRQNNAQQPQVTTCLPRNEHRINNKLNAIQNEPLEYTLMMQTKMILDDNCHDPAGRLIFQNNNNDAAFTFGQRRTKFQN